MTNSADLYTICKGRAYPGSAGPGLSNAYKWELNENCFTWTSNRRSGKVLLRLFSIFSACVTGFPQRANAPVGEEGSGGIYYEKG